MAAHIVEKIPDVKTITFILESGIFKGKTFEGYISANCLYPTCSCADIKVTAREISGTQEKTYTFYLSEDKKLISRKHITMTEDEKTLARSFAQEVNEEQWNNFMHFVYLQKNAATKTLENYDSIELDFTESELAIEQYSEYIGFKDLFPFSDDLYIKGDGRSYFLLDQYCLNSACRCQNVLFFIYDASASVPQGTAKKPQASILYDYKKHSWEFKKSPGDHEAEIQKTLRSHKAAMQKIGNICKDRHKIMRTIFRNYRERTQVDLNKPITIKAGRNDSCPCGSGKKYKKCCGR